MSSPSMAARSSSAASAASRRRKTHNKSRNGCVQCKKRHYKVGLSNGTPFYHILFLLIALLSFAMFRRLFLVIRRSLCFQCDEIYPTCTHCKRLGSDCSLNSSESSSDPEVVEKQLNIDDLRLLHSWCSGNGLKFSDHEAEESCRQERGREIELGFQHPYVLHLILAIAALNLTSKNPNEHKWYALAISHHGAAIRLARPHIAAANSAHSEAVFNFSCFNSLFAFAEPALRPRGSDEARPPDYIGDLLDSFRMSRGIRAVISKDRDVLAEKGATNNPAWSYGHLDVESNISERYPRMLALQELVASCASVADTQRASIQKAIHSLFVDMATLDETPKDHSSVSLVQRWAIGCDKEFIDFCDSRHPLALVILAHYALLVNKRTNIWFLQRWPQLLLEEIEAELRKSREMQWANLLDWPRKEIRNEPDEPMISEKV